MMFKTVDSRVEVRVYAGYDKEKKRSIVKLLGSFPVGATESPELLAAIDKLEPVPGKPDNRDQMRKDLLMAFYDNEQSAIKKRRLSAVYDAVQSINFAADCIKSGASNDPDDLAALDIALAQLRRVMGNIKRRQKPASGSGDAEKAKLIPDADKSPKS